MTSSYLVQKVNTWIALTFVGSVALLAGHTIYRVAHSVDGGTLAQWSLDYRVESMEQENGLR